MTTVQQAAVAGVQLTAPAGWDSESFVNANGMGVCRVASYSFAHDGTDDVGQTARASMQASDVLINIIDFTATDPTNANGAYVAVDPPLVVDGSTALGQEGYPEPVAAVIQSVQVFGRNLHVSVAFGSRSPSAAQVTAANAVMATLAPA